MKIVVVLNRNYSTPVLFNACGHMLFGLHKRASEKDFLRNFEDSQGTFISVVTDCPLIILTARDNARLKKLFQMALQAGIIVNSFVHCMISGSPDSQQLLVKGEKVDDLEFIGVALYGQPEAIDPLTKRFSLMSVDFIGRIPIDTDQ